MRKTVSVVGIVMLAGLAWTAPGVQAAAKCTFYIVHGIPGQDVGKAADLPVDITFNNVSVLKALKYGKVSKALRLDPGKYTVKVFEAGQTATALIQKPVVLGENEQASIVIHLTTPGKATVAKFTNDLSAVANRGCRLIIHAVSGGQIFGFELSSNISDGHPYFGAEGMYNGNKMAFEICPDFGTIYRMLVMEANPSAARMLEKSFAIVSNKVQLIYVVGTGKTATFAVITKVLPAK